MSSDSITAHQLAHSLIELAGNEEAFLKRVGSVIADALDYVLDGEDHLDCLEACEKTYIGTKVEKRFLRAFNLPNKVKGSKQRLDTVLEGVDLDLKHTIHKNWMIPPEAINQWCLLIKTDFEGQRFSCGLLQMLPDYLTKGGNRDKKISVNAIGRENIHWLGRDVDFPVAPDPLSASEADFRILADRCSRLIDKMPALSFADVERVPSSPGIYMLSLNGITRYIGKAIAVGGLKSRLKQHEVKLRQARNIDMSSMSIRYLACDKHLATGLEDYLIARRQCDWNGSGFGSKVAGAGRPNQKVADWDVAYCRIDPARVAA